MITHDDLRTMPDKELRKRIRHYVAYEMNRRGRSYKWFIRTSREMFLQMKDEKKRHIEGMN